MLIKNILEEKNISIYRLSQMSHVPYATLNDIVNKKTNIMKCNVETIYALAKALDVSMEALIESNNEDVIDFDLYKSNVCHRVKEMKDIPFLIEILEKDEITALHKRHLYAECLYLLAMVDYLSRIHNIPRCIKYDELRKYKLKQPLYPKSLIAYSKVTNNSKILNDAKQTAIPEFIQFNIVESEVRNIV